MDCVDSAQLDLFHKPSRIILAGHSGSGKTVFLTNCISHYLDVFKSIIVWGGRLENFEHDKIKYIENDDFDPYVDIEYDAASTKQTLLVFDDMIFNDKVLKIAAKTFVYGRHRNFSAIFTTQNLLLSSKLFRIISLNATHFGLFKMRDQKQLKYFARTFLNDSEIHKFIELYKKQVLKLSYGYLFIDFKNDCDSPLFIRTNLFKQDQYESGFTLS